MSNMALMSNCNIQGLHHPFLKVLCTCHTLLKGNHWQNGITSLLNSSIWKRNITSALLATERTHKIIKNDFFHARQVSTLSTLAAAFNSRPQRKVNLSLRQNNAGLFLKPELQDYSGFYLLQQKVSAEVDGLVQEAIAPGRSRKIVSVFDQLSDTLCQVADMADFVRLAHPDHKYSEAAGDTNVKLSSLVETLNTNTDIYKVLKQVLEHGDVLPWDDVDLRVAELFMFDFQQSGIHLDYRKRKEFVDLNESIMMLGSYFQQGSHKGMSISKEKLPANLRHVFGVDGDSVMVTGLFSDHYSDAVREAAYRIFLYPDKHQEELLNALLSARHQLAKLVGFPTFSHRANRGTMMESPEVIMQFLDVLSDKLKVRVGKEMAEILQLKKEQGGEGQALHAWDLAYYTALGRQRRCSFNAKDIAPYLSLGCVMSGLNELFSKLWCVQLQPVILEPGEAWHYDVHKLAVIHEKEGVLGYIYCDFFERPGKPNQDCHFTIRGGRQLEDGTYQHPIVVLQMNMPIPEESVPTLLTPSMMENLFHEFGHAMHSMLGRTKYQHVTGTRCPTDFAEVPSVLMEFFASDPRIISSFARHFKTGEPLPANTVKDMCASKRLFTACDLQQQAFYSILDQVYHGTHPLPGPSTTAVLAEIQARYSSTPYVPNTAWQLRFGHLVGYGARYYAYLISRAVAAQLWNTCFSKDPFDRTMGEQYREKMLQHGGGRHPRELVQDMLGEIPSVENLVDALIHDYDTNQQFLYR